MDSAVQFKDELISKKFPPDSGFSATYHFTIEGKVPEPLWIVIERPDLYKSPATARRSPRRRALVARQSVRPDRHHGHRQAGLQRRDDSSLAVYDLPRDRTAYVLGDFSLKAAKAGS